MRNKTPKRNDSQAFDDSAWLDLFAPLEYASDRSVANRVANLLNYLLLELDHGPMGITNVAASLENALQLIFPFTSTGHACMILFKVSLGRDFPAKPDTLAMLSEAMKRTKAALERGPVSIQKKRSKRSRR